MGGRRTIPAGPVQPVVHLPAGGDQAGLHIVDADGNLIGQWDQPPGGLDAPTSTWTPQMIYFDDYRVPAEAGGTPPYRLQVGLYDPESGERLSVVDSSVPNGGDYLELKTYADVNVR